MSFIAPLIRLPLVAGTLTTLALALGVAASPTRCPEPPPLEVVMSVAVEEPELVALELQVTEADSGCLYYSAFDLAPVEVEAGDPQKVLHRSFSFMDGCDWESEERLVLEPDGRYRYTYTERALACPDGRPPAASCTRSGYAVEREQDEDHQPDEN